MFSKAIEQFSFTIIQTMPSDLTASDRQALALLRKTNFNNVECLLKIS